MRKSFDVICKVCDKAVRLYVDTGELSLDDPHCWVAKAFVKQVAPAICHDHCMDDRSRKWLAEEKAQKLVARAQEWAGICPPLYQSLDVERLPDQAALAAAMAWGWGPKGLVLFGPTGFGKTRIAYQVAAREFAANRTIAAMTHPEFSGRVIKLMDGRNSLDRWIETLSRVDIFFLDDLGKSRFTDYADRGKHSEEVLFDVFERRTASLLPTIFTCNLTGRSLKDSMSPDRGAPFLRRVNEFCDRIHVDCGRSAKQTPAEKGTL